MILFGIDIGGTTVKIGAFKEDRTLIEKWEIPTKSNSVLEDISQAIHTFLQKERISIEEIYGFGIGIPGIVKDGIAVSCVNLGWQNRNIKQEFEKALGFQKPIIVLNDANMAAYGEAAFCDLKLASAIFITLGTGVGGGIIIHNQILEGTMGLAGELGHILIDSTYNFQCSCGAIGCLETLASTKGMRNLVQFYQKKYPTRLILNESLTTKDIIDAAKEGDPLAHQVFEEAMNALARALASLSVIINPDAFIIGGGISNAKDFLLNTITKKYKEVCIKQAQDIPIYLAKLKNDAGIFGACAYLIQKKFEVERNGKC